MNDGPMVLATGRAAGKTTQAIRWMLGGERIGEYPGWNRVLVVPLMTMKDQIRQGLWGKVEDIDHRLYSWNEWKDAHGVSYDVEVVIDEINMILPHAPGCLVGFTITAEPWHELEPVELTVTEPVRVKI